MLVQAISILVAAIGIQGGTAAPAKAESVKLQRVYKSGDNDTYAISAALSSGGGAGNGSVSGEIVLKILSDPKEGLAEAEWTVSKLVMSMEGNDMENTPSPFKTKLNKNGMPATLAVKDEEWIYVLASLAGYLPVDVTEVGKEFTISWSCPGVKIAGKGALTEIVTEDGKKLIVVKSKATVTPDGEDDGVIEQTAYLDLETGRLIKAEGKVDVGSEMSAKYSIKKAKPAK